MAALAERIREDEDKLSAVELSLLLQKKELAPGELVPAHVVCFPTLLPPDPQGPIKPCVACTGACPVRLVLPSTRPCPWVFQAAARRSGAVSGVDSGGSAGAGAGGGTGGGAGVRNIHAVVTGDSNPYMTWQMRQCYYWYKKAAAEPGSELGAFTRILHTGEPDGLMGEIPTVVVAKGPQPDPGAPPIQRPSAVIRWMEVAWPKEARRRWRPRRGQQRCFSSHCTATLPLRRLTIQWCFQHCCLHL